MTDAIDLKVAAANTALTDSGVQARLRLVHAVEVDYDQHSQHVLGDLDRLAKPSDGHLDGLHELRDRYAADLVSLFVANHRGAGGAAYRLSVRDIANRAYAFSVVVAGTAATVFAHELGHNMGLAHDRYGADLTETFVHPYAFGYVNKEAFKPGASASARWRTIMSYGNRCSDAGFACTELARFSNPDQSHLGDALGVPASSTETGADGPADARKTLNDTRDLVASYRRTCTSLELATPVQYVLLAGGTTSFDVRAPRASDLTCVWETSVGANSDFLTIASPRYGTGDGIVEVTVPASATARTGTLTVAGKTATVHQVATMPGICGRTPQVVSGILRELELARRARTSCAAVTASDFAHVQRLDIDEKQLRTLKQGDFDDLGAVWTLGLDGNGLTALPEGAFSDMGALQAFWGRRNSLTTLPANAFAGSPKLWHVAIGNNPLTSLDEDAFAANPKLGRLYAYTNRLTSLPADIFDGLAELRHVNLAGHRLTTLPGDVFDGLANLNDFIAYSGRLRELPDGLFSGLSGLRVLWLQSNPGAPFPLELALGAKDVEGTASEASRHIAVLLPPGAPFPMRVGLEVDGGTLSADAAGLGRGATESAPVTLTHSSNDPALVSIAAAPPVPTDSCRVEVAWRNYRDGACYQGLTTRAGPPLTVCSASRCPADVSFGAAAWKVAGGGRSAARAASFAADTWVPMVTGLAVSSDPGTDGTYGPGDRIRIAAALNDKAKVTGTPRLSLTVGGGVRQAVYQGGAGTESLAFEYAVAAGDHDADGVSVAAGRIALNGGTVTNEADRAFDLSHAALPAQAGHRVDGVAPTVQVASAAATPVTGPFTVDVTFSESVSGLTAAGIAVTNGRRSNFRGGGADYSLTMTPNAGLHGAVTVRVPAGAALDAGGNGNAARSASFAADTRAPALSSAQADGSSLSLAFGESLDESSTPGTGAFTVRVGGAVRSVTAVSVSGSETTLTLSPAVENGDSAITVSYVAPATSPIRDLAGNAAAGLNGEAVTNVTAQPLTDPAITSGDSFTVAENETAVAAAVAAAALRLPTTTRTPLAEAEAAEAGRRRARRFP